MIQVGIYIRPIDPTTGPVFSGRYYTIAYNDLFKRILSLGAEPILLHSADKTYKQNGVFSEYWTVDFDEGTPHYTRQEKEITIKFLYDKFRFPFDDIAMVNPPKIRDIAANKYLSYLFAPEQHELTFLVRNAQELETVKMGWNQAERLAIKELDSNGGQKVFVGLFHEYKDDLEFPLIVQKFIDTSGGVPGLVEGMHDVRVAIYNGEVIHGLIRRPGESTLKANMKYGGESTALYVKDIPLELVNVIKEMDKKLERMGDRYYSADFGYNGKSWKLFELNAFPGLATVETDGEAVSEYMQLLAEHLVESARGK